MLQSRKKCGKEINPRMSTIQFVTHFTVGYTDETFQHRCLEISGESEGVGNTIFILERSIFYHQGSELGIVPNTKNSMARFERKKILITKSNPKSATKGSIIKLPGFFCKSFQKTGDAVVSSSFFLLFFILLLPCAMKRMVFDVEVNASDDGTVLASRSEEHNV